VKNTYEYGTGRSETSEHKTQASENHLQEIQHSQQGESLKSKKVYEIP
jgi:hypothetical protein